RLGVTAVADGEADPTSSFRQVSLPLRSAAEGCANARAFVRGALVRWGVPGTTVDDVEQVSSELVAHAFRVGARQVDLELALDEEFVEVQVSVRAMEPARAPADTEAGD